MSATQGIPTTSPVGHDTPRVDGLLKVSDKAQYTSEFHFPGMLYAVWVEATIANGRVVRLDTAAAEKIPGVRAIFRRENIGKIFRSVAEPVFEGICEERHPPFEDDVVRYYGQYIAPGGTTHVMSRPSRIRLPCRADQVARFNTQWSWVKWRSPLSPMTRKVAVTARAPGASTAPRSKVWACSQTRGESSRTSHMTSQ